MSSPFGHDSSGLPDSDSSSAGTSGQAPSRFAPVYIPSFIPRPAASSHFYSHPARTSVLGESSDLLAEPAPGLAVTARGDESTMDAAGAADKFHMWSASGILPSFSRAFDMFTLPADGDDLSAGGDGHFFVPSYLKGSMYMQMLQEAHKAKLQAQLQAQKESSRSTDSAPAHRATAFNQPSLPPGGHRGLAHNVIERQPPALDDDDAVAPLPTRWDKDDIWSGIDLQPDCLNVKYTGPRNHHERDLEASAVRADHYMPPQCGLYYFEVQILQGKRDDTTISVGFSTKAASLSRPVGWEADSWGYHGDDGRCFAGQNIGRPYGPPFSAGDVVGCGVSFRDHTAFFTKNGVRLGIAFHDIVRRRLYPSVSLRKPGEHILVNFGQLPFVYNIDDMMREQRERVQKDIDSTDTSELEGGKSETDLIQALVLQFLQHDGYVETARAFAQDIKAQKEALNLDPNVTVAGINIKDDEDANNRQRIRRAILEGDIDRALKYTRAHYPGVLHDNEEVLFKLRCRKFIEMVRRAAQMRTANDGRKSNGHVPASASQDMDLDTGSGQGPGSGETMDMDGSEQQMELAKLEQSMLEYGQGLEAQYANDERREVSSALAEIWALVAYSNPLTEPQVSHLLDRKGRTVVAEELNSAILSSLGKSSRASLETMYAQTSVLLEDLRRDGGPGAFVSLQDVLEGITALPQI